MTIGWVLLVAGLVLFVVSGPVRAGYVRRQGEPRGSHWTRSARGVPRWVSWLNPVGLVLASVGAVLLIGLMFGALDA